jgi:hypothetical protein
MTPSIQTFPELETISKFIKEFGIEVAKTFLAGSEEIKAVSRKMFSEWGYKFITTKEGQELLEAEVNLYSKFHMAAS